MKKFLIFFVSMTCTCIILLGVNRLFWDVIYEDADLYELNTYFSIENNEKKIIHGESYAYDQCLNEEGQIEFTFQLGTFDERNEFFELSILHDYHQEEFSVNGEEVVTNSYEVELSNDVNETQFSVVLDAEKYQKNSIVIFTLRQDTKEFRSENEFLDASNTVNVVIELVYDKVESNDIVDIDADYIDITEFDKSKGGTTFQLSCLNREENEEILVQSSEELKMRLDIDLRENVEYIIVWCNLNSNQVKINGKSYCIIKVPHNHTMGKVNLSISMPEEIGRYELEVFGEPIKKSNTEIYQVLSSNRYTIKVE